jgi:hypothetical protein
MPRVLKCDLLFPSHEMCYMTWQRLRRSARNFCRVYGFIILGLPADPASHHKGGGLQTINHLLASNFSIFLSPDSPLNLSQVPRERHQIHTRHEQPPNRRKAVSLRPVITEAMGSLAWHGPREEKEKTRRAFDGAYVNGPERVAREPVAPVLRGAVNRQSCSPDYMARMANCTELSSAAA